MIGAAPLAVAWDVDGTLVDSEPLHLRALQSVCRAHGVGIADFGATPFVGVAIASVWQLIGERFGPALGRVASKRQAAFCGAIETQYRQHVAGLQAMPGAVEAVHWLARRRVPMCAVSSSGAVIVEANLAALSLREFFSFTVTLDDVGHPKPHREPYVRAVRRLGLPAARVVAIEDSATGVGSAVAAGLEVIFVDAAAVEPSGAGAPAHHRLPGLRGLPTWWLQRADSSPAATVPPSAAAERTHS